MTETERTKGFEVLVTLTPSETRRTFWLLTDGPDSRIMADAALEAVRGREPRYASGAATMCMRRPRKGEVEGLDGHGLDFRGPVTEAEIARRVEQSFLPPGERNEYAGWSDARLDVEITRCQVGAHKEWPHHRDHTLRTAARMQEEMNLRRREREVAPVEDADASPAPGM